MVTSCRSVARAAARSARVALRLMLTAGLLVGLGCSAQHGEMAAFVHAEEAPVASGHYVVQPPDTITIHAPGSPELDGVSQGIRADGKVSLRLLGEVEVAGLTSEEIAEKLRVLLARYYVDPEVVVEVPGRNSQFFYLFGEVGSPGPKRYTGHDTLLTALADSSPNFFAWKSHIRVTRPSRETGERHTIIVDLDNIIWTGDLTQNFLLQPGDIIEVPPTPLAWVGHRVREVLYPVGPALSAYNVPASAISTTHVYEDEFGSDDNDDNSDHRDRRRWR